MVYMYINSLVLHNYLS